MARAINKRDKPEDIRPFIHRWTDFAQRMEIARAHGVTHPDSVANILSGKSINWAVRTEITEKAKQNQRLDEEVLQLQQIQQSAAA